MQRIIDGTKLGLGIGLGLSIIAATALFAQSLTNFNKGDVVSAATINKNFSNIKTQLGFLPPVGTIVAWHKSFTGTPAIPDGWVECDGSTVADPDSPYNTLAVPNLNTYSANGGRFLRGGTTSGTTQDDQFQSHRHGTDVPLHLSAKMPGGGNHGAGTGYGTAVITGPTVDGANGAPRAGNETRPANMSVVWIIRIK